MSARHHTNTCHVSLATCLRRFLVTVFLAAFVNEAAAQIRPVDLGTLGGHTSEALAANANGQVVGGSETPDGSFHAFSWTAAGGMIDLGTLGDFPSSFGVAVNARGQVIGNIFTPLGAGDFPPIDHAFSWTATGGMIDLGIMSSPALCCADAVALNNRGEIAGNARDALGADDPASIAFLWTAATGRVALSTSFSQANALNASGRVVGTTAILTDSGLTALHAFSWTAAGGMRDLGTLGGSNSEALAINASGQVVGTSDTTKTAPEWHAFSWTVAGGMIDLGAHGAEFTYSRAVAVSDAGQVVGYSQTADYQKFRAFSWTLSGGFIDLGMGVARAVNAKGQVVVNGTGSNGTGRAFLWTAAQGMVELAPLAGFSASSAWAVNDGGQVVGVSVKANGVRRASLWQVSTQGTTPIADAYVRGGAWASTNFGSVPTLLAKKGASPDNTRRSYLKFDLNDVGEMSCVKLRLHGNASDATGPVRTTVYAVSNTSWDEHKVTWNTRPDLGIVLGTVTVDGRTPQWVEVDVTKFVRSERRAGRNVISLALRSVDHTSAYAEFQSRDAGNTGPRLVITR
jgi:probable HAF family extracellular repeat protein